MLSYVLVVIQVGAQESPAKDMMTFPRPIEALDNVWIEELTMLEVRDALKDGKTTALILTGGIEENGPYLTTGKHNHVLAVMGDAIARRLGNALVAPIVTIEPGNPERAGTPGGIRLSQETFQAVLRDMATSLKAQGFKDIFLIGDSGGNQNDNPQHVRLQQRIAADKASINSINLLPVDKTLEHGRRLIEFRTDVTVAAILAAIAASDR